MVQAPSVSADIVIIPQNWDIKCDYNHILCLFLQSIVPELQIATSGNQKDIESLIVRI
jgi:hypothetical protein